MKPVLSWRSNRNVKTTGNLCRNTINAAAPTAITKARIMASTRKSSSHLEVADSEILAPALIDVKDIKALKYSTLMKQARAAHESGNSELARGLAAYAYTRPDGFGPFCKDICGTDILYDPFHEPMLQNATGFMGNRHERHRMTLAFRGSLKSQVYSIDYIAWRIARDIIESRGDSTISIGLASERQGLAKKHLRAIKSIIISPRFSHYFGQHKPTGYSKNWGGGEFTSGMRSSDATARNSNPTSFIISLGAEQTGYHCDLIVADDLQAYASSFSPEQLDKCWELYVLLHSILNPDGEMNVIGTRWSFSDIYQRIFDQTAKNADEEWAVRFNPLVLPIIDPEGNPMYPTRFSREKVEQIRSTSTSFTWASQYMLEPLSDESRKFNLTDLRYVDGDDIMRQLHGKAAYAVMGFDPNWVSEERIRAGEADSKAYTVIVRFVVDSSGSLYMTHCYRGRPNKTELCQELWKQWEALDGIQTISIGCQQVDYKYLKETLDNWSLDTGVYPNFEFTSSSQGQDKKNRIEGALEGRVRAHKLWIKRDLEWLEHEFYQFPYSKTFDGLDAISNAVKVARTPMEHQTDTAEIRKSETDRHIDEIHSGSSRKKTWKAAY